MMQIIADENMPWAVELFSEFGEITRVNGRQLQPEQLIGVDVLLVRSVTQVNAALLAKANQLKFVGSATIGTDHVDLDYLQQQGIAFASAPGCNAQAVGEYAFSALLELAHRFSQPLQNKTVGIIGAGNTGSALGRIVEGYGMRVMYHDPWLEQTDDPRLFVSLERLIQDCDVISLHVPLINNGAHPTKHLFDETRLKQLKAGTWLLNCCRGGVIDNQALLAEKSQGLDIKLVLDVWENEPEPLLALIPWVEIATPHIAGYSLEGKARGTFMLYQALAKLLQHSPEQSFENLLPKAWLSQLELTQVPTEAQLRQLGRLLYDITVDDLQFRQQIEEKGGFDRLRKNHTHRREFSALTLCKHGNFKVDWLNKLGFN